MLFSFAEEAFGSEVEGVELMRGEEDGHRLLNEGHTPQQQSDVDLRLGLLHCPPQKLPSFPLQRDSKSVERPLRGYSHIVEETEACQSAPFLFVAEKLRPDFDEERLFGVGSEEEEKDQRRPDESSDVRHEIVQFAETPRKRRHRNRLTEGNRTIEVACNLEATRSEQIGDCVDLLTNNFFIGHDTFIRIYLIPGDICINSDSQFRRKSKIVSIFYICMHVFLVIGIDDCVYNGNGESKRTTIGLHYCIVCAVCSEGRIAFFNVDVELTKNIRCHPSSNLKDVVQRRAKGIRKSKIIIHAQCFFIEVKVFASALDQRHLSIVNDLPKGTIVILKQTDVEVGHQGIIEVQVKHAHCKHESSVWGCYNFDGGGISFNLSAN